MKQFVNKVIWFLIPILLLSIIAEYSLRQLDNVYKFKKDYLEAKASTLDVLVLGSSHAYYNINPDYLSDESFNAGAVSQSFDLDLAILEKYEDKFQNLNTIILPVSYFSFYGILKESPEKWRMKDYVLYYDLNIESTLRDNFEILSNKPKNIVKKLYANYNNEVISNYSEKGWGNNYVNKGPIGLEHSGIETAKRHSQKDISSDESILKYNQAKAYLESIAKWANRNKVQLLLFIPPAYKSYYSHLNNEQLKQLNATLEEVSNIYANCSYFNLLSDSSFTQNDFYDADHLNHNGAKKLSKKIDGKIK